MKTSISVVQASKFFRLVCYSSILTRSSTRLVISPDFVIACIVYAREHAQSSAASPAESEFSQHDLLSDYASVASSNSPPHLVSKLEAMFYYSGISPTPPKLVYRTGSLKTPWVKPTGPESYRKLKQARGVFVHRLSVVWKDVGPVVRDLLNAQKVAWTSIDVVRFITDGMETETRRSAVLSSSGSAFVLIRFRPRMPSA